MGFSKFEFPPMGSFRYLGGYLVWRVQEKQAWLSLLWTVGRDACKFGCSAKTYKISAVTHCETYYTNTIRVISQSAVDLIMCSITV